MCLRLAHNLTPNGDPFGERLEYFVESIFGHFSGTPFSRVFGKTGLQNATETGSLFETSDLAKV